MQDTSFAFRIGDIACMVIRDGDDFDRNVLLLQTGEHRVVIDTGTGDSTTPAGVLSERLRTIGIDPTTIDVVVISHADFDHIGGAITPEGTRTFPNARHIMLRAEWEFWSTKPDRLPASDAYDEAFRQLGHTIPASRLAALRDTIELVESPYDVMPGVQIVAAPGHTPGYSIITIISDGKAFAYVGDLLYDPTDISDPDWYSVFDYDRVQVVQTRRQLLTQAAHAHMLLLAYHLPFPGLGYVSPQPPGWGWSPYQP
jgi:glyoxylase-like metal-dependent hydrolase (beta-lactamase superfamily II)